MIFRFGILCTCLLTSLAVAKEKKQVVDLGSLKIEGAARGPEMQFIETLKPGGETVGKMLLEQLQTMEKQLLKPELPRQGIQRSPSVLGE